jgi:hypothetical protein
VLKTLVIIKVGDDDGLFKKVADNGPNMVKGCQSLGCLDHTIERSVLKLWNVREQIGNFEARMQDSMIFHTQLRIIFDEGPGKHSAVLCARENHGC